MKRRKLVVGGAATALFGLGGCLGSPERANEEANGSPEPSNDENRDEMERGDEQKREETNGDDVPGCAHTDEWPDDSTIGPSDPDPTSIVGHHGCASAERPEPTGDVCTTFVIEDDDGEATELHSVGIEPYPDPPTSFDDETLRSYVHEYEKAYSHNAAVSQYGEDVASASVGIHEDRTRVLERDDGITAIRIEFGVGLRIEYQARNGYYEDSFGEAAVYGIDETGIGRADAEYTETVPEETPDPVEEGMLLECF